MWCLRNKLISLTISVLFCTFEPTSLTFASSDSVDESGTRTSRISNEIVIQLDLEAMPRRPSPIFELGPKFLGNGNIGSGIELPTGAVWQPALLIFGTYRTAIQSFHADNESSTEWVNNLDLFANLQLSGSERFLLGIRPLQQEGRFSAYQFEPDRGSTDDIGWNEEYNSELTTFFFEGDFGEIFPDLDRNDRKHLDVGFAIGRQPVNYQAGMLINDSIDAIGLTRNTLFLDGISDFQMTFLFGWNEIHRGDNIARDNQKLFALLFALDSSNNSMNLDLIYVADQNGEEDGFFWGVSDVRRIGHYNLSSRLLGSHAIDQESTEVGNGNLLFTELSWTPPWTDNNIYINIFLGIDHFTSAAREPSAGGPLGRTGILFRALQLGRYDSPLSNDASSVVGGSWGLQWFIDPVVNQFIFELGARHDTDSQGDRSIAAAMRYRHVFGRHVVAQADVFTAVHEGRSNAYGGRLELRFEF